MIQALLLGVATALPLAFGALLGIWRPLAKPVLATVLAFGAGTLIASVGEGLFRPAFDELGGLTAAAALLLGTVTFVGASRVVDRREQQVSGGSAKALGWVLLLGVLLDGVPENAALGVSGGVNVALLAAIAIGNAPEAIGGASSMAGKGGMQPRHILLIWLAVAVGLAFVVPLARLSGDVLGTGGIAAVQAFAGGAVLAVLSDSMIPEAFEDGGPRVALATAAGFTLAFVLGG